MAEDTDFHSSDDLFLFLRWDLLFSHVLSWQVGVIDFSMYLKDGGHSSKSTEG